jgi:hypothetical protein
MLVLAQAGEAREAKGIWEGPGKKSRKLVVPAKGGAVLTASVLQRGL